MKIIVAGSRDFTDYDLLCRSLDSLLNNQRVAIVSGGARGADAMGERYAQERGLELVIVPAEWDKYGRGAGPKRNAKMASMADVLVAFWDGTSSGTRSMINLARKTGLEVHVVTY